MTRQARPGKARLAMALLGLGGFAAAQAAEQSQRPTFRTATDLVQVDVQVVDRHGTPVPDLGIADFTVALGGENRRVLSVEYVNHAAEDDAASSSTDNSSRSRSEVSGGDAATTPRRLYVVAVDETSFSPLALLSWKEAIKRFVAGLGPADLVGLYAYPVGGAVVPLTTDHQAVLAGTDRVSGRLELPMLRYHMSLSEMADITRGDPDVRRRVADRECGSKNVWCETVDIPREAQAFAMEIETRATQSLAGLAELMRGLSELPERKTVVVVSGGLFQTDQIGGMGARGDVADFLSAAGQAAARANVNLYVLHLDRNFIEAFSPRTRTLPSMLRDVELLGRGLDRVADAAGGALIRVQAGNGDYAFDRVRRETASYYLLGVEAKAADRDGEPRHVSVKVNRRGTTVRSRSWVVIPAS